MYFNFKHIFSFKIYFYTLFIILNIFVNKYFLKEILTTHTFLIIDLFFKKSTHF